MTNKSIYEQVDKICNAILQGGGGGGGTGSVVNWEQLQTTGNHIANITINGRQTEVYSPDGGGGGQHVYSTEEHVVGVWLDGRPVYEKSAEIEVSDGPNMFFTIDGITNDCVFLKMDKCIYPNATPFQITDVWGAATNVNCSIIFHNNADNFQYGGYSGTLRMTLTYLRNSDL